MNEVKNEVSLSKFIRLMVGNGAKDIPLSKLIRDGNIKLPSSTAIFNMGSALECPSRKLGFCQAISKKGKNCCYARKAEYSFHPACLPFRRRQGKFWQKVSAKDFATQFLITNNFRLKKFKAIRLNEASDFHSQECVDKAETIAKYLARFKIKVYGYTARQDLDFSKVRHLILLGSGFHKDGLRGTFKMVNNLKDKPKGFGICKGDCSICDRCLKGRSTAILRH